MKITIDGEFVITKEELDKIRINSQLNGAILMIGSIQENVLNKLGDSNKELVSQLNIVFDKCKQDLIKAKRK
jgi:hypothetical protein